MDNTMRIYFLRKKGEEDGEGKTIYWKTYDEIFALVNAGRKIKYTNTAISLKDLHDNNNAEFFEGAKQEKELAKELVRQNNLPTTSRIRERTLVKMHKKVTSRNRVKQHTAKAPTQHQSENTMER